MEQEQEKKNETLNDNLRDVYIERPGMQYARGLLPLMSGVQYLTDLAGWTNKADLGKANIIRDADMQLQPVRSQLIGNYIRPNLRDPYEAVNMRNAVNNNAQRSLMNSGNHYIGALNANNFRNINSLYDTFQSGIDYNNKQIQAAADFNRHTDLANAESIMKANQINAGINAQRYQAAKDYADAVDAATSLASASRAQNRNAFLENVSKWAQERYNMDMANVAAHTNPAFFNDYLYYNGRGGITSNPSSTGRISMPNNPYFYTPTPSYMDYVENTFT